MTAYQVLKKYGWIQGNSGSYTNGFCLMGAIYEAYSAEYGKIASAKARVEALLPKRYSSPIVWNDVKSRKKSEVLALVKKARV